MSKKIYWLAGLLASAALLWIGSAASAQWGYAGAARNPYTGGYVAGRGGYNPYTGGGGATRSAYNPYTGTYGRSAVHHNPYTGNTVSGRAAYNPYTGNAAYRVRVR